MLKLLPLRLARRIVSGRRVTLAALAGATAALSLLILALGPHPGGPDPPGVGAQQVISPHGHQRRIQQEAPAAAADYGGGEQARRGPGNNGSVVGAGAGGRRKGGDPLPSEIRVKEDLEEEEEEEAEVIKAKVAEIPREARAEDAEAEDEDDRHLLWKARETAITALQHGFKLTEGQQRLLERMSPTERQEVETKVSKIRALQEKAYLQQLRAKGQVRPRRGGGEEVVSTPQQPIRFPAALKKVHPRDWPPQYAIFLNLTHYPWPKSPSCANYSITFARPPGALAPLALASFPSSGNTWIRYLVEGATGLFTGSLYDDTSLTKKGMYGEAIVYDSGMTILQKTHGYTTGDAMKLSHEERLPLNHLEQFGRKGVVVIRNPFKALISHRHLDTGGHTGYAPKAHFLGKGWAEFVRLKVQLWRDFYVDWLTLSTDLHLTFYERVKEDPVGEMRRILAYLGLPRDEGRLACVGMHSDGLFKRRPSKNLPLTFDPFTRELKELVYGAVDDVEVALREKGRQGAGLPLALYEFYDAQEAEEFRKSRSRFSKARSKGREESGVS